MTFVFPIVFLLAGGPAVAEDVCTEDTPCPIADEAKAGRVSKVADHIGHHCSYSTWVVVRRVLDKGEAWTYTGRIVSGQDAQLDVAAPFRTTGPAPRARLIATELLDEVLAVRERPADVFTLRGRVLEQGGERWAVVTGAVRVTGR